MTEWTWIRPDVALAIHDEQLAEHGGGVGLRDEGALLSALARPQNLAAYERHDAATLAAAYAFGVARNHPFVDGNKRTAWVLARLFLSLNDQPLEFSEPEAIFRMVELAGGEIDQAGFAEWLRARIKPATGNSPT